MQVNTKRWWSIYFIIAVALITVTLFSGCSKSSNSTISGSITIDVASSALRSSPDTEQLPLPEIRISSAEEKPDLLSKADDFVDFVPGQILVKYKPGFDTRIMTKGLLTRLSMLKNNHNMSRGALVLYHLDTGSRETLSRKEIKGKTLEEIDYLNRLEIVEYAQPNYIYHPFFVPNDNNYSYQWNCPLIKLDRVWDENLVNDVSSIIVAVIDTGIARSNGTSTGSDHPDIDSLSLIDEYDFISDYKNMSLDGDGIDNDATDPGDDPDPTYATFHGTHVIGIIGAVTNNSEGIAGIAGGNGNGVRIMPLRALGYGGGTTYDIAQAIEYAAGLANDSGTLPSKKADIINMSFGSISSDNVLYQAVIDAYNAGCLLVAAAGNNGTTSNYYPASYDEVLSVSSVDTGSRIAPYSTYGQSIDISAPGGDMGLDLDLNNKPDGILSTLFDYHSDTKWYQPIYAFYQGTSMATPHVSGVAALVKQALKNNPNDSDTSPKHIISILTTTAIDIGQDGKDQFYGYGLVNPYSAVLTALGATQNPVLFPFPKELLLSSQTPQMSFILKNIGDSSTISITGINKSNGSKWLSINPTSGTADSATGLTITVTVDTSSPSVSDSTTHMERLEISYGYSTGINTKNEYVYVLYNHDGFNHSSTHEVGTLYVVALDPDNYDIVKQTFTTPSDGYVYQLTDLPADDYIIGASTDRDGDNIIFEPEEAYGFYPNRDQPTPVTCRGKDVEGIDFTVINSGL